MSEEDFDTNDIERRMTGALSVLRSDLSSLRTGRASGAMLDSVSVEAYGTALPLSQCATVTIPEPRLITVNVWDKENIKAVEKGILNSGLGINPVVEGTVLRLPIPELNEERRKELAKLAGNYAENARIAVRNVRKDGMDKLKKMKGINLSEDDHKLYSEEVQSLTDKIIKDIDYDNLHSIYSSLDIASAARSDKQKSSLNSNLKLLNYMSYGIPCVASPESSYLEIARHGEECLFAQNNKEFLSFTDLLINDYELRLAISEKAYKSAKKFHISNIIKIYKKILSQYDEYID